MKTKIFHSILMSLVLFSGALSANVGGVVFLDTHNYGVKDSDEGGISDANIVVTDKNGNEVTVSTDENGNWSSTLNAPVRVQLVEDSTNYKDSVYGSDSKTNVRLIQKSDNNVNFGMYKDSGLGDVAPIEVGNLVWADKNGDGVQDAGERGLGGVDVELYCNNNLIDTAVTDENGYYIFSSDTSKTSTDNLRYGITELAKGNTNNCKIVIEEQDALCSLNVSDSHINNDELDNNGQLIDGKVVATIPNTIDAGENNHNIDIGFVPCQVCIGDYVWNDANKNGIQDDGEKGIKDVFVTLLNEDGSVNNVVQTDSDGKYEFCELFNGEKYKVQVKLLDTTYVFSPKNQGNDKTKDSNVGSDGKSGWITIGTDNDYSIDAGMHVSSPIIDNGTHCIGSVYWYDKNLNKVLDSGDTRMGGMKVWLYDENKNLIDETITNDNGEYRFCGLNNGNYYVKFQKPDGYLFLPKNQGSNSNADSDANSNGWSDLITVNGNDVNHIDAGIYCSCSEGEVKNWEKLKASFSGYVVVIFILLLISVTFRNNLGEER